MIRVEKKGVRMIPNIQGTEYIFLINMTDDPIEMDFQLGEKFSIIEVRSSEQKVSE